MNRMVESLSDAKRLADELEDWSYSTGYPAGFDTETTGCNPDEESPVGRARVWCATFAWAAPEDCTVTGPIESAFVRRPFLDPLIPWLEDAWCKKVGSNIFGYDRHACHNEGIYLRGIEGCTQFEAKLINPDKRNKSGLKALAEGYGFEVEKFADVVRRPAHGPVLTRKLRWSECPWCGWTWPTVVKKCKGCDFPADPNLGVEIEVEYQNIQWSKTEYINLDELWRDYPERRKRLSEYAVKDSIMSLVVHWAKRRELEAVRW